MSMLRPMALVPLLLLPVACGNVPHSPDSPYYVLPKHSRMVLEQPITLPSPGNTVWLQFGKVLPGGPNRYQPACQLEMRKRIDTEQTVQPDTFEVTKVERAQWEVANESPYRHAALLLGSQDQGGGPMAYEMRTIIYLDSPRQPQVFRLNCQHWDRPWFPEHLTINQIAGTLQGLFRIEPPG